MAKRFKFRISRLIIHCFRPCCSRHPSTRLSAFDDDDFLWKKEDKWHVIAKVYDDDHTAHSRRKIHNSSASGGSGPDDVLPLPSSKPRYKKKKRTTPRCRSRTRRISTSSADRRRGLVSSDGCDDDEETEALVSSSTSDTPPHKEHKLKKKKKKRKEKTVWWVAARVSAFEGMMGWRVEGKVRESVAVVKKSEDPYNDFRRSMMEMIVEKKMFEQRDLEQLLSCFLSLNSTQYHPIIVQAFTDIWETLF